MNIPTLAVAAQQNLIWIAIVIGFSIAIPFFAPLQQYRNLWPLCLLGAFAHHWQHFIGFMIVLGMAYTVMRSLSALTSSQARWRWTCITLIALIVIFTFGRVLEWDRPITFPGVGSVALFSLDMWLTLRFATLFWEVGAGAVPAPRPAEFILWTCLPFTLIGPLLRYSEFPRELTAQPSLWKSGAWWMELLAAAAKFCAGILLPAAHAAAFQHWPHAQLLDKGTIIFFTGPFSFYLQTAGLFSLMAVLAAPAGFKVPQSFNYPIGRENISAFWMNWNTTATYVFRDYLFYNRWGLRGYNIYVNTVILFTLVGLWHAANAYWIFWGVLHGLLFCTYLAWRKYGKRIGHIPLRGTPVSRTSARILTYVCVCLCWYVPSKVLQRLGAM